MSSIIRLKENDEILEMFETLQNTMYKGLGKTEIIRAILAEKTWEIEKSIQLTQSPNLDKKTQVKIKKAYQNYKQGNSVRVKKSEIGKFLEQLENEDYA